MSRWSSFLFLGIAVLGFFTGCTDVDSQGGVCEPPPAPADYSGYLTFVADGSFDPADPNYTPPTLEDVMRDTFKLTDEEAVQVEAGAKAFFISRFGVDVDDPANQTRIFYLRSAVDPRANYRAVTFSGYNVPEEGFVMRDIGFGAVVTDPAGFDLGGEFAGIHVPPGTTLSYGRYRVQVSDTEAVEIGFAASAPGVPDMLGNTAFRCDLDSEVLGKGDASLVVNIGQDPNGLVHWHIRNVLLFN
ncbi:MAG: hypothetical protein IPK82_40490 [Polyangiaceae bacterium]|nr:hypothetical protein [Polyangiaceae bacterium]